ncbi:MAG TPA: hypothetical protein VFA26_10820 [Gemmataceae bacterium]|nr:hypothetical protein [Gemmataceae bacterium]
MMSKVQTAGALAALGLCAWFTPARAGDTVRLDLKGAAAPAATLGYDGNADTTDVRWHGGFRGSWHGGYRAFYGPRFYGGFYGPRFYAARYFYGPRFFGGYYGGFYRPFVSYYYYAPPVYYSYPYPYPCYYPVSYSGPVTTFQAGGVSLSLGLGSTARAYPLPVAPTPNLPPNGGTPMPPPPDDGTYPYDGGPRAPVPMPKADPAPMRSPAPSVPLEGRAVSLPSKPAKYTYQAYGERPGGSSFAEDRVLVNRPANGRK